MNRFITVSTYYIYPTPLLWQDMTQGQFLSESSLVWIQSFLFQDKLPHKAEEPSLP